MGEQNEDLLIRLPNNNNNNNNNDDNDDDDNNNNNNDNKIFRESCYSAI